MTYKCEAIAQDLTEERDRLLKTVQIAYTILADCRHHWKGRDTLEGQGALCAMRDAIAASTGKSPQDVQDEYNLKEKS